jgi:cob(I)alamin adenosyltransferase
MTTGSSSGEWFAVLARQEAHMPKLTRIYTRTGDDGTTGLVGGQRIPKNARRIDAYGTVDELSSAIGLARASLSSSLQSAVATELDGWLAWTQDVLFNLGCELATLPSDRRPGLPSVGSDDATALERAIDRAQQDLAPLDRFIHPGGAFPGAFLHLARTVARRAERGVITLAGDEPGAVSGDALRFLNRLSDALFVWSRWINHALGRPEYTWNPDATPPTLPAHKAPE